MSAFRTACQICSGAAVQNNSTTQHFQKLVHHVMELLARAEKNTERAQHAANAVYFLRLVVKHITENLSAADLISFVNELPTAHVSNGASGTARSFHVALLQIHLCKIMGFCVACATICACLRCRSARSPARPARPVAGGCVGFGTAHTFSGPLPGSPLPAPTQISSKCQVRPHLSHSHTACEEAKQQNFFAGAASSRIGCESMDVRLRRC